jgi:hypothetical protein
MYINDDAALIVKAPFKTSEEVIYGSSAENAKRNTIKKFKI